MKYIKYVFGISILLLVIRAVDFASLKEAFSLISLADVALLLLISYALIAVSVLKWRAFLRYLGVHESFNRLFGLYLVGYFVNLVMPSYIGGDVVRALQVGGKGKKEASFSAMLLERYTGLAAMIVLAVACVSVATVVTPEIRFATYSLGIAFFVGSVAAFLGICSRLMRLVRVPAKIVEKVAKIEEGVTFGVSHPPLLLKASLLSLLFHTITIVNTVAVAHAVGWTDPPLLDLFVVVPLILLVGALPLSPQGLGIQEGAFFYFLHSVGASEGEALAVALVLRAKSYFLALLGGVILAVSKRKGVSPQAVVTE